MVQDSTLVMATALPTGTLTYFFSDIVGSTRLLQRLGGPEFNRVLGQHGELIRSVVRDADAREVKTMGDGFFVVFRSAAEAVGSASDIQRSFDDHVWPEGGAVQVRVGLHTGEAELGGDDYTGLEVHRAARIGDAANGGQILVSDTTRALARGAGYGFKALGDFRLKDLETPETLYQVVVPGLPTDFPPPRSVDARPNNLPVVADPIIGRDGDLETLESMFEEKRLVSLLGPGGIGKTRLAIALAGRLVSRFTDGAVMVDLSAISDPELVVGAIAAELGTGEGSVEGVVRYLRGRRLLLVLDNFEQVIDARGVVSAVLEGAEGVSVLVTTQAPLRVAGEQRYRLEPLQVGSDGTAVQLFLDRAHAVDPSFDADESAVRDLVGALDGLPLAVELAAARVNLFSPEEMLERFQQGNEPKAADGDRPERHRSTGDALVWSFDLLGLSEKAALRRAGVFAGGMTIAGAEQVISGSPVIDVVASIGELVDRSLIVRERDGTGRFRLLDGVRRFALDRLEESGERGETEAAHTALFVTMASEAEKGLQADRGEWWRARLESEIDNVRDVLGRLVEADDAETGLGLVGSIWRFMQSRGHLVELGIWLDRLSTLPTAGENGPGIVRGLMARGALAYWQDDLDRAVGEYRKALEKARGSGDDWLLAEALFGLSTSMVVGRHDLVEADRILSEAEEIYRRIDDPGGLADVLTGRAIQTFTSVGPQGMKPYFEEALRLYLQAGRKVHAIQSLFGLAGTALAEGRHSDARDRAREGLAMAMESSDLYLAVWGLDWSAAAQLALGNPEKAGLLLGAADAARRKYGATWSLSTLGLDDPRLQLRETAGDEWTEDVLARGGELTMEEAVALLDEG
jgi:predicted ATPase/class 3 adenylate cyclase